MPGPDDAEVLARDPPRPRGVALGTVGALLFVLGALLAGSVVIALHYRSEAQQARRADHAPSSRSSQVPSTLAVKQAKVTLVPGQTELAELVRAVPGSTGRSRARITVMLVGARRGQRYTLVGNDCASNGSDHAWARATAGDTGLVRLATPILDFVRGDEYWLWISPSPHGSPPGFHGEFAMGDMTPFPAGHAPCTP